MVESSKLGHDSRQRRSAFLRPAAMYEKNQLKWAERHHGEFVLIHDDQVVGFFADEFEAYREGKGRFGAGRFYLRCCVRPDEETAPTFHSRVT